MGDLVKTLGPREQLILTLRFGLGGESPRTLIQVSHVLGVSKERVLQIQDRALKSSAPRRPATSFAVEMSLCHRRNRCREERARLNPLYRVR